jgi:DNA segregation ATPase FtsK/SpoIIIE-like protein
MKMLQLLDQRKVPRKRQPVTREKLFIMSQGIACSFGNLLIRAQEKGSSALAAFAA